MLVYLFILSLGLLFESLKNDLILLVMGGVMWWLELNYWDNKLFLLLIELLLFLLVFDIIDDLLYNRVDLFCEYVLGNCLFYRLNC